jgi:hypothetical protein
MFPFILSPHEYKAKNSQIIHTIEYYYFVANILLPVVRVLDYRSRGPGFDTRALQKKVVGLERGPLSLVSATEELLDRKVAAPV